MAASFTRPDPSSPASIAEANFATSRKGFDPHDVRDFLRRVAGELARLHERQHQLESELLRARDAAAISPEQIDQATLTRLVGDETARILQTAHETAAQIKARAEEGAASVLNEATDEAARVREDAEVEAAHRRTEAAELAHNEVSHAKDEGRQMVNEARAYRERVLGELARRRDLARDQIEQLMYHRDRLLAAYVQARDVAHEIIGAIEPIQQPDDLVDLEPITGEVAQTVPGGQPASSIDDASVVALFPDRDGAGDGAADEGAGADDPDATGASQVDDLFARLRAEEPPGDEDAVPVDVETGSAGTVAATNGDHGEDSDDADDEAASDEAGDEAPSTPFEHRDVVLTPLIVAAARRLKRVLADEQNDALDTLRQAEPVGDIDALVGDEVQQIDRYLHAVNDDLEAAAQAGAASVTDQADAIDLVHSGALGPVREAVASGLITPLRERLAKSIDEADGDNEVLVKRVRSVYREWKTQHIDTELDDVFRLAHGRGVLAALPASTPVTWIVDPNGPACPDAEDNSLAGEVAAGEAFPTGHMCAPAHAGCRCLLAPTKQ